MDNVVQLRMNQLEQHVGSLENRLRGEEDRRQALEAEIRRLREANSRLAGESQTAAQQLKRFTDWFFQTIELWLSYCDLQVSQFKNFAALST